jgi:hypothetical protein
MKMMYSDFKSLLCHRSSYFHKHKLASGHSWITGLVSRQWTKKKCFPVVMVSWEFFFDKGKKCTHESQTNWI